MTYVLVYYLSTISINGGMATATAQFATKAACEAAGNEVKSQFGSVATRVRWFCTPIQVKQ